MASVTEITRQQYVSIVEIGGKAYGFYGGSDPDGVYNEEHASICLLKHGLWDYEPDPAQPLWVYYTLTE